MSDILRVADSLTKKVSRRSILRQFLAQFELRVPTGLLDDKVDNAAIGKPPLDTWTVNELIQMDSKERAKVSYTDERGETYRFVITMDIVNEPVKKGELRKNIFTADGNMFEL